MEWKNKARVLNGRWSNALWSLNHKFTTESQRERESESETRGSQRIRNSEWNKPEKQHTTQKYLRIVARTWYKSGEKKNRDVHFFQRREPNWSRLTTNGGKCKENVLIPDANSERDGNQNNVRNKYTFQQTNKQYRNGNEHGTMRAHSQTLWLCLGIDENLRKIMRCANEVGHFSLKMSEKLCRLLHEKRKIEETNSYSYCRYEGWRQWQRLTKHVRARFKNEQ